MRELYFFVKPVMVIDCESERLYIYIYIETSFIIIINALSVDHKGKWVRVSATIRQTIFQKILDVLFLWLLRHTLSFLSTDFNEIRTLPSSPLYSYIHLYKDSSIELLYYLDPHTKREFRGYSSEALSSMHVLHASRKGDGN